MQRALLIIEIVDRAYGHVCSSFMSQAVELWPHDPCLSLPKQIERHAQLFGCAALRCLCYNLSKKRAQPYWVRFLNPSNLYNQVRHPIVNPLVGGQSPESALLSALFWFVLYVRNNYNTLSAIRATDSTHSTPDLLKTALLHR